MIQAWFVSVARFFVALLVMLFILAIPLFESILFTSLWVYRIGFDWLIVILAVVLSKNKIDKILIKNMLQKIIILKNMLQKILIKIIIIIIIFC